jgi:hypothetical protein
VRSRRIAKTLAFAVRRAPVRTSGSSRQTNDLHHDEIECPHGGRTCAPHTSPVQQVMAGVVSRACPNVIVR